MDALKNLGRPPFANYDLVVYFGGGLFALPFIYRYLLHPFGVPLPSFVLTESNRVTLEIIRGLALLMAVYVIGHLIAYLSSQLVEKTVDRFLGKMSAAIIVSMESSKADRDNQLKAMFRDRAEKIVAENAFFPITSPGNISSSKHHTLRICLSRRNFWVSRHSDTSRCIQSS